MHAYLMVIYLKLVTLSLTDQYENTQQFNHATPLLLPGKSHGRRSLVGCSPRGFRFPALEKEMAASPAFLPGESQGRRSLVGCRLWGRTESDTTEATQQQQQQQFNSTYSPAIICVSIAGSVSH